MISTETSFAIVIIVLLINFYFYRRLIKIKKLRMYFIKKYEAHNIEEFETKMSYNALLFSFKQLSIPYWKNKLFLK